MQTSASASPTRTTFPGIVRSDRDQAFACEHCRVKLEIRYIAYRCPDRHYELLQAFSLQHKDCRPVMRLEMASIAEVTV